MAHSSGPSWKTSAPPGAGHTGLSAPHALLTAFRTPRHQGTTDERNRPEPDLLLTTAAYDGDRTWFVPDEVRLVIEVVSSESARRDRTVKLRKYAEAGIPHYWCIEDEDGAPVVHVYELDEPTGSYAPAGIFRGTLKRPVPFEIGLDLDKLTPPRSK